MVQFPFFSIIIPSYNRAHLIGLTLKSILNQSLSDFEILVVDDGSADDTETVVRSMKDARVHYFKKENEERGAARNFGTKNAKGKYVNFFDSDDVMLPHHLQTAYDYLMTNQDAQWLHLAYDYRDQQGTLLASKNDFKEETSKTILFDNVLSCNGIIMRKDVADLHPFREERALASSEDWELWIRLVCRYRLFMLNTITSTVVTHNMRSLNTIRPEAMVNRDEALIACLQEDPTVMQTYGDGFQRFIAERYSFRKIAA